MPLLLMLWETQNSILEIKEKLQNYISYMNAVSEFKIRLLQLIFLIT